MERTVADRFTEAAKEIEPKLRRALVPVLGPHRAVDAASKAMAYAWEHWDRISRMDNPAGYLYRVARSKARRRRLVPLLFTPAPEGGEPWVEPGLQAALRKLSPRQRTTVMLVRSFGYSHAETSELLGISRSTVQNHVERGLDRLRREIPDATSGAGVVDRVFTLAYQDAATWRLEVVGDPTEEASRVGDFGRRTACLLVSGFGGSAASHLRVRVERPEGGPRCGFARHSY